jgi:hypothetical protein
MKEWITINERNLLQKEEIVKYETDNHNGLLYLAEASRAMMNASTETKEWIQFQTKRVEEMDNNLQVIFDRQAKKNISKSSSRG